MSYLPLQPGDEIRVIAPSQGWNKSSKRRYEKAKERLESLGYVVTFGKNVDNYFHFGTASREDRAEDFNEAYRDIKVKLVVAINGGWSANELLPLIDWELVRKNPKPLIGFSDITVLLNALYAKAQVTCFLGPNFVTFGRQAEWQYTLDNFQKVMNQEETTLLRSRRWNDYTSQLRPTKPWQALQSGQATARTIGGNLGTFYLLQGTEYQPDFNQPFIFLMEDDEEPGALSALEVSRRFESILQLPGFRKNLVGLVIGRFHPGSHLSDRDLKSILDSKNLGNIPIASRVDFGHTLPMLTLPIGGKLKLDTTKGAKISVPAG